MANLEVRGIFPLRLRVMRCQRYFTDVVFFCYIVTVQKRKRGFFRAGKVCWNKGTLIKISSAAQERKAPQRKISEFSLLDTFKTAFQIRNR